jgi:hypothetical protein
LMMAAYPHLLSSNGARSIPHSKNMKYDYRGRKAK